MGLAPAYQANTMQFPWKGMFSNQTMISVELLVFLGHAALSVAYIVSRRRAKQLNTTTEHSASATYSARAAQRMNMLLWAYVLVAGVFAAALNKSLFQARLSFSTQAVKFASLPFGGTLYFAATAGAIVIPAYGIALRRRKVSVSTGALTTSIVLAVLVTNPFIGSRFLTGATVVAMIGSAVAGRLTERLLPALSILLLIVLFPTVDVLRGNGSGSTSIRTLSESTALVTPNFDAFEMMAREVSLAPVDRRGLPSPTVLAIAPVVRWVPILARPYIGKTGGAAVAIATGMQYTNVSMPLWAEGDLIAGLIGDVCLLALLGWWIGYLARPSARVTNSLARAPTAALLFIVLRGSLYEVFDYMVLAVLVHAFVFRKTREVRRLGILAQVEKVS
jgi:hypothetical protein